MLDGPLIQIICDGCSMPSGTSSDSETDAFVARLVADGWRLNSEDDLCPACVQRELSGEPKPTTATSFFRTALTAGMEFDYPELATDQQKQQLEILNHHLHEIAETLQASYGKLILDLLEERRKLFAKRS